MKGEKLTEAVENEILISSVEIMLLLGGEQLKWQGDPQPGINLEPTLVPHIYGITCIFKAFRNPQSCFSM